MAVRYMMLLRIDLDAVPEGMPSAELLEEMGKLIEEMTRAGVLLETAGLRPSEESTRVHLAGGRLSVTDGPFAEAKEMIGGYAILQAGTKQEAVQWASRFLEIHGDELEMTAEIRQIEDPQPS